MDIVYCPNCNHRVFILRTEEDSLLFDMEPQVVYLPTTGELVHAQVAHRCLLKPKVKRSVLTDEYKKGVDEESNLG